MLISCLIIFIQGGLKVLEWLSQLELGVAGLIFELYSLKFQNQYNLDSCNEFETLKGVAQKLSLPRKCFNLKAVLILLRHHDHCLFIA